MPVLFIAARDGAALSAPVRINDYPGLGSKGDGKSLDAAAISGTLHVAWQGVHYTNRWASPPNADDTNIYYDAAPLAPQPTVQKVYALAGNASALRSGPKGQDGTLYYLHGDHNGSLVLVTDATGNEVGRVWYDPFGKPAGPSSPTPCR